MAELITPRAEYLWSYLEACKGFKEKGLAISNTHDPDDFENWRHVIFQRFADHKKGLNLPAGYVPESAFWLVEEGEFIGVGSIRHRLTPLLEQRGGHIGYMIRCDKWGQGYGTIQLGYLLREAAKLGIKSALITCNENNIASAKVMEKNGAIYQDTVEIMENEGITRIKRYWVSTPGSKP